MNHCKQVAIEDLDPWVSDCDHCAQALKDAKEQGLTHVWVNQDDHVALDPNLLEDREATNRKYGLI